MVLRFSVQADSYTKSMGDDNWKTRFDAAARSAGSGMRRKDRKQRGRGCLLIDPLESRLLLSTVSGTAYADFNANGVRDAGEPALAGWTVYIDANHNLKLDAGDVSTTTSSAGLYTFTGLPAGNYLIEEVPKAGWGQSNQAGAAVPAAAPTGALAAAPAAGASIFPDAAMVGPPSMHQLVSRSVPNDPLFSQQWNFYNTGQTGGLAGADADLVPAWTQYQGDGVRIGIVDDGVDYTHADLAPNYDAQYSYDFNDNDPNPAPVLGGTGGDNHGTAVAGLAVARGNDGVGITGAAPDARFSAIRLTSTLTTDAQEAAAFGWQNNNIDIYSNSWGPDDDGLRLEGPGPLTLAAIQNAIATGRNGKGNIFTWAAGNGLAVSDNVNYDGYANSRYVIAVTAIDHNGNQTDYSEPGAPILISAYSDGASGTPEITTTDRAGVNGYNSTDYVSTFGGTSAVAPTVAGVVALMLQANPNLTWRDVQAILVNSAERNDPTDTGWSLNGAKHYVNSKFGFGAVDAAAAVNLASTWTNLSPEVSETTGTLNVNAAIPDKPSGGSATPVTRTVTLNSLTRIEKVEVVFNATHPFRGDLKVTLTSPDGTQSILADKHSDSGDNYSNWTFTSARHWDEIAKGAWTISVQDMAHQDSGTFLSWKLTVYGTAVNNVQYVPVTGSSQTIVAKDFFNVPPPSAKVTSSFLWQSAAQQLTFTFDKDMSSQISADDLEVHNDTLNQTIAFSAIHVSYSAATQTATYTFTTTANGSLPDGNYTARLKGDHFTSASAPQLDGNGDGVPGDDAVVSFFTLTGDADHDRTVGLNDLLRLANHYGITSGVGVSEGDFDGDGLVGLNDLLQLSNNYGTSLPTPAESVPAMAPAVANEMVIDPQLAAAPIAAVPSIAVAAPSSSTSAPSQIANAGAAVAASPVSAAPKGPSAPVLPASAKPAPAIKRPPAIFSTSMIARPAPPKTLPRRR